VHAESTTVRENEKFLETHGLPRARSFEAVLPTIRAEMVITLGPVPTDDLHMSSGPFDPSRFDEVIALARAGDPDAVEELFRELQPRLLRFLRSQESRAADDLAAEVWLAVAGGIGRFEGDWSDFRAWIFSIARRRLADHRRTALRRRTDTVDVGAFQNHIADDRTENEALDKISGGRAAAMITALLSADQAEVLLLRVLADLDVDQVAHIVQRSPNWVRVTQHRAMTNLTKRLGPKIVVMR
jgi:RNA polymerase sigma-70 factor (ECF subfamily)